MTFTELKAKPGDYVYSNSGLVVGRINNDLTEDNRWTANGQCSIANGFIKASGITPKDARSFHNSIESNPNGYILKGYTICLQLKELPVEMWAVKAAEILGGEFDDFEQMLEELSKQPEKERQAKLSVLANFFTKEKKASQRKQWITPTARKKVDEHIEYLLRIYQTNKQLDWRSEAAVNEAIDAYLDKREPKAPMSLLCGPYDSWKFDKIKDIYSCYRYFDSVYEERLLKTPMKSPKAFARYLWQKELRDEIRRTKRAFVAFMYLKKKKPFQGYNAQSFIDHYNTGNSFEMPELKQDIENRITKRYDKMVRSKEPLKELDIRHRYFAYNSCERFISGPTFVGYRESWDRRDWEGDLEDYKEYLKNNAS